MTTRLRAFTLLEVVIATALLAVIAVTVVHLLVDATVVTAATADEADPADLRDLLDSFLENDAARAALPVSGTVHVQHTKETMVFNVTIRLIAGGDPQHPHDWIEAQHGRTRVLRYLPRRDQVTTGHSEVSEATGTAQAVGVSPGGER